MDKDKKEVKPKTKLEQIVQELRFGLVIGLALTVWTFLEGALGFHNADEVMIFYSQNLATLLIILGISNALRTRLAEKSYSYFALALRGFLVSGVAAIVSAVGTGLYLLVNPNYAQVLKDLFWQEINTSTLAVKDAEVMAEMAQAAFAPSGVMLQAGISVCVVGLITTLIASFLLRLRTPKK